MRSEQPTAGDLELLATMSRELRETGALSDWSWRRAAGLVERLPEAELEELLDLLQRAHAGRGPRERTERGKPER